MKQYFKRFVAVTLCIAVCFSFFVVPSYATVSDAYTYVVKTFPSFLRQYLSSPINTSLPSYLTGIADALMNGTATDEEIQNAYTEYVSSLDTTYGSHVVGPDGYFIPLNAVSTNSPEFMGGINWTIRYLGTSWQYVKFSNMVTPVNGYYKWVDNLTLTNCVYRVPGQFGTSGSYINIVGYSSEEYKTAGNTLFLYSAWYLPFNVTSSSSYMSVTGSCGWMCKPTTWTSEPSYAETINNDSNRMTTILPAIYNYNITNTTNQYHIGTVENNAVTNVYDTNIFNETTNVFSLPGDTPTTYNITDWTYDYSTRTYVCVDSDSNVYIVQYGDDAVHVTVPDGSGGTTSYKYYYIYQEPVPSPGNTDDTTTFPGTSSDNYDDDPNTTGGFWSTIWKAFKNGLADLIAGIVKDLFKGLKAIISGILNVFSGLVTGFFDAVNGFFNSFSEMGVFQFWNGTVTDLS